MSPTLPSTVRLPGREPVTIYVLELADGRIVSRTEAELAHAPDEERIAAGLDPREGP
jgi:hypothetical protein